QLHGNRREPGYQHPVHHRIQEPGELRVLVLTLLRPAASAYIRPFHLMGARAAVRRLRLLVLALLLVLSASAGEAPAQDSLDIVAVVNDQPISKIDLIVRLQLVMHSTGLPDSPQLRARMAPEVLRSLIDERLKKAEAQRQGITATRADVERA